MVSQVKSFLWSHTVYGEVRIRTSVYQIPMFSVLLFLWVRFPFQYLWPSEVIQLWLSELKWKRHQAIIDLGRSARPACFFPSGEWLSHLQQMLAIFFLKRPSRIVTSQPPQKAEEQNWSSMQRKGLSRQMCSMWLGPLADKRTVRCSAWELSV